MPHLKKKIRNSKSSDLQVKQEEDNQPIIVKEEEFIKQEEDDFRSEPHRNSSRETVSISQLRKPRRKPTKPAIGSRQGSKNIVKNYGRAMSSFAYSEISQPYLEPLAQEENVTVSGFHEWIQNNKENIDGIERLRWLLIVTPKDTMVIAAYKRIFQRLCVIFLKFFSVNWIYSGKLTHKQVHLNYRFKMLRRVKNPEMFTYLK
jgi:hypothetical protein